MRFPPAIASAILLLALTGCAGPAASADPAPSSEPLGDDHGEIAGAHELAEPALHLATIADGVVAHLDLLDEHSEILAEIEPVDELVSDGRYLFAIRAGSVTVIDSGVWTWSHVDHFHYYEAASRVIGEIEGTGEATVVVGGTGVGVLFDDEAVLLDAPALADGELVERFRIDIDPHDGMLVPLVTGAVITDPDASGTVHELRLVADDGALGESIACADAAGTITTVVGVVVGCSDGAVMFTAAEVWERIPAPEGAPPATAFAAREARPTVAALAGDRAFWLLDTRERSWTRYVLDEEIVRVSAVDDEAGRVLAIAADGSLLVIVDGAVVSRTEPLVAASLADPASAAHVDLVVDQTRVYVNGPVERMLWEIDPADDARIARSFETEAMPLLLAGTGR